MGLFTHAVILVARLASLSSALPPGVVTIPLQWRVSDRRPFSNRAAAQHPWGLSKRDGVPANIPLTNYINRTDSQWYCPISVGTPAQSLSSTVLWDTGSTDLLIPRSNCSTCGVHSRFDPSSSSTFSPEPNLPAEIFFGTGGDSVPLPNFESVSGTVVTDTVSVGGLSAYNQSFLLADVYGPALNYQPIDGIMGLGPANISGLGEMLGISALLPFYWNLYQAGALASPVFSWFLRPGRTSGAELTLGGTNPARYKGAIQYIDLEKGLSAGRGKWVMQQSTTIYVGGTPIQVGRRNSNPPDLVVLDTGTPFLLAPDFTAARDLYAAISPNITLINPLGAWGAPCAELDDAAVDVTLTFGPAGGVQGNFTVFKRFLNLGPYPGLSGICQAAVSSLGEGEGEVVNVDTDQRVWAVGSPLLKAYYTVWDGIDLKVGFAGPRCGGG